MPVVSVWDNSPVQTGPEPEPSYTSQHEDDRRQQQIRLHHRCSHIVNIRICPIEHRAPDPQIFYFTSSTDKLFLSTFPQLENILRTCAPQWIQNGPE